MKSKLFALVILLVLFWGCKGFYKNRDNPNLFSESIIGSWRLYNLSNIDSSEKYYKDKLLKTAQDNEVIQQGIVLSFFKDGTFTEIWGSAEYKSGKWRYPDKEQTLYLISSGTTDTVIINQGIVNDKQTLSLSNHSAKIALEFIRSNLSLADYHEDPFYYMNNLWRIKPAQQENAEQLQERLANYFKHLVYVLKSSKERKLNVVSFEFSQGIARIYNGGIGIYPMDIIPRTWINTYYNDEDATTAYKMFKKYLETSSYKGAGIGEWIEDDYNILLSIYGDVKQGKFPKLNNYPAQGVKKVNLLKP